MTDHPISPATEALADRLVEAGSQLALLIDHAVQWAAKSPPPGGERIDVAIARMIAGVLEPLEARHGDAVLAVAADVLEDAVDCIADNVLLVPLDQHPGRAAGRPPARKRRRR